MAHSYSHLYQLPTTGLRFFTVYGPWGRPDMSPVLFADRISRGEPIDVFNFGNHSRDFTYIDDIVEGVMRTLDHPAQPDPSYDPEQPNPGTSNAPYRVYNIGNDQPVQLMRFIELLEQNLGRTVEKNLLPMQAGDVPDTWADVSALRRDVGYAPDTSIEEGVARFVKWYRQYHQA
jgi:UDP-glucuronate 4-epimerase